MSALAVEQIRHEGNVHQLRSMDVQEVYEAFLSSHHRNSPRTAEEYDSRVKEFFQLTLRKDIKFVTVEDIKSIKNADVQLKFVDVLLERGNKTGTVRTKLHSVKSFYDDLLKNEYEVNPMALKVKLKVETKHHEALSLKEYFELLEFMAKEKSDMLEKYLLSKTLYHTGQRKTATLSMTWKENFIQKKDSETGEMIWIIKVKDKGQKWKEAPISDDFYNELQQLNNGQENVFAELSKKNAYKRYENSMKKFGKIIAKSISIHTMKATAITIGYMMTKDINLCKQLGGHSSIATTEIYIKEEKSYVKQISYNMSRKIDEDALESLSNRELLDLINANKDIKMQLLTRLGISLAS